MTVSSGASATIECVHESVDKLSERLALTGCCIAKAFETNVDRFVVLAFDQSVGEGDQRRIGRDVEGDGREVGQRRHTDRRSSRSDDEFSNAVAHDKWHEVPGGHHRHAVPADVNLASQHGGELLIGLDVEQRTQLHEDGGDVVALRRVGADRIPQRRHRRRRL